MAEIMYGDEVGIRQISTKNSAIFVQIDKHCYW